MTDYVQIVGAGLAGSEAALVAARNGVKVRLFEMRPTKNTPVHSTGDFAEIVCSNSLGSMKQTTAGGAMKGELALLASPLIAKAVETMVPAGHALAVDRERFAAEITAIISENPLIEVVRDEVDSINPDPSSPPTLIATGPLSSDPLLRAIALLLGEEHLFFFDAISPSIEHDSIDTTVAYYGSRYEEDSTDYLNCPFTKEQYEKFHHELVNAERTTIRDFEPDKLFEGCLPVEIVASRDIDALRFGPLKPVGLENPNTGERDWAVVQLRREQVDTSSWNMVGFQTRLTYSEQKRVFRMIPGCESADFTRFGSMHRNAYLKSPYLLEPTLQVSEFPRLLVAGCLAGVEGYVEDIITGHLAGLALVALAKGSEVPLVPTLSMAGSICRAVTDVNNLPFQPVAATIGLLPGLDVKIRSKKERRAAKVRRSLDSISGFVERLRKDGYFVPEPVSLPR